MPDRSANAREETATRRNTNLEIVGDSTYFLLAHRSQGLVVEDDVTLRLSFRAGGGEQQADYVMQEQLNELRQAIASDVTKQIEASEQRLRDGLSKDLASSIEASEQRLRDGLSKDLATSIEASEQRLRESLSQDMARQLETAQQHLEGCMQMHAEDLKDLVTKAAEGYGGTLDGIQRELRDFRAEWRNKADDTDGILANHAGRIVAIEQDDIR